MKFYVHFINPHDSAEHADTYFEGWHYGIWEYDTPAPTPFAYRVQSKNEEAAKDSRQKMEKYTENCSTWSEFIKSASTTQD